MHDHDDSAIAALALICVFGVPIVGWIVVRWMAHRERMAMIFHGVVPPAGGPPWRGAAQAGAARRAARASYDDPQAAQQTLRKGITLAFIGFALTCGLSFIGYGNGEIRPGPWLLGGLIPLFIGIAQILIALLSGATLRPASGPVNPYGVPPPVEPPPAPSAQTFEGSYTYRPGATTELRPPPAPPDRM